MFIFDNPEFIRLQRSKLRPRTQIMLGATAVLILGGILAFMYIGETDWGRKSAGNLGPLLLHYFFVVTGVQLAVVSLYGLTLSAQSVTLERERNTMDFQRLVGIGPNRLAVGKLFGAPIEAFFLVFFGALFAGIPVMGGAIGIGVYLQSQLCVFVFGLVVGSFGLMCSSMTDKTSKATGMIVVAGLLFYNLSGAFSMAGQSILASVSPTGFLYALYTQSVPGGLGMPQIKTFELYGIAFPYLAGFMAVNLSFIALFFTIAARRIANEEYSFLSIKQAAIVFGVVQLLAIGILINGVAAGLQTYEYGLKFFHGANSVLLLALAFALAPAADLVRGRLHRSRPNEHWKVFFELHNRLHDAPGIASVLLFAGMYAILAAGAAAFHSPAAVSDYAVIAMVCGMGIAMSAAILYIQVYTERAAFKIAMFLLAAALILPPIFLTIAGWWERTAYVSPALYIGFMYDFNLMKNSRFQLGEQGPGPLGVVWSCPLICVSLAVLGSALAAMRIRYLLDTNAAAREHERAAQRKADAALPQPMAAARARAQAPVTTSIADENGSGAMVGEK